MISENRKPEICKMRLFTVVAFSSIKRGGGKENERRGDM